MDKKKDFLLSVVGLAILLVGAVIVLVMDYPLGLLLILPSAIPHIVRLYALRKNHEKDLFNWRIKSVCQAEHKNQTPKN